MIMLSLILNLQLRSFDCGVPGLTKFLRSKYKNSWHDVSRRKPIVVKHVAIEMNQILHSNLHGARDPQHFISKVFRSIDTVLKHIIPTESLVMVFDGAAPFAKIQTQRSRRQSSPDSSLFTPGTYIMNTTVDLLLCYTLKRIRKPVLANVTVYISGSRKPGEGELKIVEWVNSIMPCHNDSIAICGGDSDLIIQVMH